MDAFDRDAAISALAWQIELGADEAIADLPVDRYVDVPPPEPAAPVAAAQASDAPALPKTDPTAGHIAEAARLAATAHDLETLAHVMQGFDGCSLKQGARNFVFSDGHAGASLMIVGEAPGRDEDIEGRPFVGRSGQLLDKMMDAIGRARTADDPTNAVYITNVLPWRPPQNRDPSVDEMAMMKAFLLRHIELAAPKCLLLLGNSAMKTLFETSRGITAMRGQWKEVAGVPAIASFHPAALLRNPAHKRAAWEDLLNVKAKLK
ncbi:uracil-DNA glycosylase [Pontivivens insulae]|uniref:Type-4 uracil-DNA glycosylase n=1 Tax=Pontivivens insulae TaxID=1639689 RepID=A0A2R8A7C5_9RHOB|nr:uracil-DNA glycosylase [Pontivivens insulae]RED18197.1 DNA polymerase [Pontivivens insulae]SPF28095.1 hypothetical protein POI8812_00393 [Pontivivens insulae]